MLAGLKITLLCRSGCGFWFAGQWRDLEIVVVVDGDTCDVEQCKGVYASNWIPLWCGCADAGSPCAMLALQSLQSSGLLQPGGIAASLYETGQQWDFPNGWAPLQAMIIEALAKYSGAFLSCSLWTLASRMASCLVQRRSLVFT
jgi:neutral trehalase